MESAVKTQRPAAWNVLFLLPDDTIFAGVYIPNNHDDLDPSRQINFSDALARLLSSFDLELERGGSDGDNYAWALIPRHGVLRGMAKYGDGVAASRRGVQERLSMDLPVQKGRYYVVRHVVGCGKGVDFDGTYRGGMDHMDTECVNQVVAATPKPLSDYRPWLRTNPPAYDITDDGTITRTTATTTPCGVVPDGVTDAKTTMNRFHRQGLRARCAITGLGLSNKHPFPLAPWLDPAVAVSHIVPPEAYDVYPINGDDDDDDDGGYTAADKWDMTWDPDLNGVVLLRHHAALWKARFVAVEPESLTIYVFAAYDTLTPYHGKKANFPEGKIPDVEALRWHWRMCVYENMVAAFDGVDTKRVDTAKVIEATAEELPLTPPASVDGEVEATGTVRTGGATEAAESHKRKRDEGLEGEGGPRKKAKQGGDA